jgi:hypothetical protein
LPLPAPLDLAAALQIRSLEEEDFAAVSSHPSEHALQPPTLLEIQRPDRLALEEDVLKALCLTGMQPLLAPLA